jgi:serine/threonine protein kinase, bacterial
MLNIGDKIENRYTVVKILGKGGMSLVYLVNDSRLDNRWVLKEFSIGETNPMEKQALEEHFITEAKICAKLSHPGIPKVIDYFVEGEKHYLVEEYVEGETLLSLIQKKKLKRENIIPLAVQLCSVLEYIHAKNIIYRDLKPDNIMVKQDGSVKLIDFGIARLYKTGKEKDTIIIGTPGFAAPEQYGTAQTDSRTDIYGLGALMHHMVTGIDPRDKPFTFDPPSKLGIKISTYLEGIIMKSLALRPEERYKTVKELRETLEAVEKEVTVYSPARETIKAVSANSETDKAVRETMKMQDRAEITPNAIKYSRYNKTIDSYKQNGGKVPGNGHASAAASSSAPYNKILILVYSVLVFMIFALLFEIRFNFWILIPYLVVAWLLVFAIFKKWGR